jgi:phage terminase Nu1 subunit (DNA packaging protein)
MNTPGTLKDARRRKELALAGLRELQLKQRQGELVSKVAVENQLFSLARTVRDTLLNVPDRVSGQCASLRDQAQIHALLTKEIAQCLEDLTSGSGNGAAVRPAPPPRRKDPPPPKHHA